MNEAFVCIKVDREERPDIDSVYMTVCQMMTGRRRLAADDPDDAGPQALLRRRPTSPRTTRFGRVGMLDLVPTHRAALGDPAREVLRAAQRITRSLRRRATRSDRGEVLGQETPGPRPSASWSASSTTSTAASAARPSSPRRTTLLFLLRYWRRSGRRGGAGDGGDDPARPCAAAASTTTSAAASTATPPTRAGSCRTSRRCSTTRRCWPWPTSRPIEATGEDRATHRRRARSSTTCCAT